MTTKIEKILSIRNLAIISHDNSLELILLIVGETIGLLGEIDVGKTVWQSNCTTL